MESCDPVDDNDGDTLPDDQGLGDPSVRRDVDDDGAINPADEDADGEREVTVAPTTAGGAGASRLVAHVRRAAGRAS